MTEVKTISDEVLFIYDENITTLSKEISKYKYLRHARLTGADLQGADFSNADLLGANLRGANFKNANLKGTSFIHADLNHANLEGADIYDTYFGETKNMPEEIPMACPREGSFVVWKQVRLRYIIKLEIPEDAKRSSATTKKCRCSKAKVLEIIDKRTGRKVDEVINANYALCVYKVGEMVYPDSFDENRWNECSHGIHFFMDEKDAITWLF